MKRKVRFDPVWGQQLTAVMDERGVLPGQLAKRLGMDKGTISRWRKGELPSDIRVPLIAKALGVPPERLKTPDAERPSRLDPEIRSEERRALSEVYGHAMTAVGRIAAEGGTVPPDQVVHYLTELYQAAVAVLRTMRRDGDGETVEEAAGG